MKHAIPVVVVVCACSFTLEGRELQEAVRPLDQPLPIEDPERSLERFEESGREVIVKEEGRGATVLPQHLLLPPDWEGRSLTSQQSLLAHEWTHVVQQGDEKGERRQWVLRYGSQPRFRLRVETQGVVEQGRSLIRQGHPREACEALVRDRLNRAPIRYHLSVDRPWLEGTLIPMAIEAACTPEGIP